MFQHAARVLISCEVGQQPSFEHLWRLSRPVDGTSNWRYAVVHKLLVIDAWIQNKQADILRSARENYSFQIPDEVLEAMGVPLHDQNLDDSSVSIDESDLNLFVILGETTNNSTTTTTGINDVAELKSDE